MSEETSTQGATDDVEGEAKALASVVRLRILRLCLDEALTNRELADRLGINPGTCLHHVRVLRKHGFLTAEEERRGARGAREVPYRATGKSWTTDMAPGGQRILIQAFLDEFALVDPQAAVMTRLGVRLSEEDREEMVGEFADLFQKWAHRPADPQGSPWSIFFVAHPDVQREHPPR